MLLLSFLFVQEDDLMSRLNMTFTESEDSMIELLKEETGIRQTTELVRYCLTQEYNHRK